MFGHLLKRGAVVLCLAAVLALPVCAEGRITTDMTMKEIRSDPAIAGSGVSTYCKGDADSLALRRLYENKTLLDYVGETTAQDSADGLNIVIENYEAGKQVTWQVYSPEEIAADSSLGCVQLFWFPGTNADGKYALVVGGNAAMKSGDLNEGIAVAAQLNKMGYSVFVLRYRVFLKAKDNAPVADLGNAVRFITTHAGQFNVQPENYALLGYSSGGHLAGVFSGDELGYKHYGVPKPGALLLGYPINNFFEYKPVYHAAIDPFVLEGRYYELNISDCVTDDYPPVYHWYGENDYVFPLLCYPAQRPALSRALEKHHVPCKEVLFPNATHGVGTGAGTDADGWMLDAANFWETQING